MPTKLLLIVFYVEELSKWAEFTRTKRLAAEHTNTNRKQKIIEEQKHQAHADKMFIWQCGEKDE